MQTHAENTPSNNQTQKGDQMIKVNDEGIAYGPNSKSVGKGGVIIDGNQSGTYHIAGDNNDVTIPATTPDSNIVITGNNNQVKRERTK